MLESLSLSLFTFTGSEDTWRGFQPPGMRKVFYILGVTEAVKCLNRALGFRAILHL